MFNANIMCIYLTAITSLTINIFLIFYATYYFLCFQTRALDTLNVYLFIIKYIIYIYYILYNKNNLIMIYSFFLKIIIYKILHIFGFTCLLSSLSRMRA